MFKLPHVRSTLNKAARVALILGAAAMFPAHANPLRSIDDRTTIIDEQSHSCMVADGGVQCSGSNAFGQLGDGTISAKKSGVQTIAAGSGATAVATSATHSCAVVDGGVQCWGDNTFGQLGDGTTQSSFSPVQAIAAGSGVTAISAITEDGFSFSCAAVFADVQCWGNDGAANILAPVVVSVSTKTKPERSTLSALGDVTITAPANNATLISGVTFDITVNAVAGTTRVDYYADTFLLGSMTNAAANFIRPTSLLNTGARVLKAISFNAAGTQLAQSTVNVTVVSLKITSPASGASIVSNTTFNLTVAATAATTRVDYYADTFLLGSMTNASANFVRPTSLTNTGARVLKAISFNSAGTQIAQVSINVTVVSAPVSPAQQALNTAVSNAIAAAPGVKIGVVVLDLTTRTKLSVTPSTIVNHASSAKWMWLAAALSKKTIAQVQADAIPTMADSDNSAAGRLIDLAGGAAAVNTYATSIGIPQSGWSLCKWSFDITRVDANCNQGRNNTNFFTAGAAIVFLEKVYDNQALTDATKSAQLKTWALLSPDTGYGGWIGTQLPSSVKPTVMHKAGWIPAPEGFNTNNEIALIKTVSGRDYAIAIATEGSDTFVHANKTIEYISCVAYKLMDNPAVVNVAGCTL